MPSDRLPNSKTMIQEAMSELKTATQTAKSDLLRQAAQKAWKALNTSISKLSKALRNSSPNNHYEIRIALDNLNANYPTIAEMKIYARYLDLHRNFYVDTFYLPNIDPKSVADGIDKISKLVSDIDEILISVKTANQPKI